MPLDGSIPNPRDSSRGGPHLPGDSHRTVVVGRTGSGKSVFATWLLSRASFDRMPWLIIDYKRETIFRQIHKRALTELKVGAKVPRRPGLFLMRPRPTKDYAAALEDTLWHIHDRGHTGLYVDESVNLPDYGAVDTIMTQGRSLKIPCIICTQRPVDISTYIFTQADFFAIFPVQRREDQRHIENYINDPKFFVNNYLPRHHCLWHDVARNENSYLSPVPKPEILIDEINFRAPHRFWWS